MTKKKHNPDYEKIKDERNVASIEVSGLHPAVQHRGKMTVKQFYAMSIESGLSPHLIASVMTGRAKPDEFLRRFFLAAGITNEEFDAFRNDYDPTRGWVMMGDMDRRTSKYEFHDFYPAGRIKKGDKILLENKKWLLVSGVASTEKTIRIYSGGRFVCRLYKNDVLMVDTYLPDENEKKNPDQISHSTIEKSIDAAVKERIVSPRKQEIKNREKMYREAMDRARKRVFSGDDDGELED